MSDKQYNGWANYETYLINLDWFDGTNAQDFFRKRSDVEDWSDYIDALSEVVHEYVEDRLREQVREVASLVLDYALMFIRNVDWHEIAAHIADE